MAVRKHSVVTLFVPCTVRRLEDLAARLPRGLRPSRDGTKLDAPDLGFTAGLEWISPDGSFGEAFSFGTCSAAEVRAIDAAGGAVVLDLPVELHTHRAGIATLARGLRDAGALAFRIEQSKVGFAAAAWVALAERGDAGALYRLAVMLRGRDRIASLGMHVFSMPDVSTAASQEDAEDWLGVLNHFQIDEDPLLVSGNTFSPHADSPRRILEWWPDVGYPEGHPCHNPFGVLHVGEPVDRGRPQQRLRMSFVPALLTLLTAKRRAKGAPLTDAEILAVRDGGVCVATEWRDAREVERARGYADLDDPERVVEVWKELEAARAREG